MLRETTDREFYTSEDEKMQQDVMTEHVRFQRTTFLWVKRKEYNPWAHFLDLNMQLQQDRVW